MIGWIKDEEYINHPLSIQLSKSQENLFVSNSNGHFISNVSLESGSTNRVRVEIDGLRKIVISPDGKSTRLNRLKIFPGKLLYAASFKESGEVTILYTSTLEIVDTIPLEAGFPIDMAVGEFHSSKVLFVAHQRGKISMHDASSGKVLRTFEVDSTELIYSMQFDHESRLYITTGKNNFSPF